MATYELLKADINSRNAPIMPSCKFSEVLKKHNDSDSEELIESSLSNEQINI